MSSCSRAAVPLTLSTLVRFLITFVFLYLACVEVRGPLLESSSFLPLCVCVCVPGSNSGLPVWWQAPLPLNPLTGPHGFLRGEAD